MDINSWKDTPFGILIGAIGGGGLGAWLAAKVKAKPEMAEVSVKAISIAFQELRNEVDRMERREQQLEADISALKNDRHRLRNALQVLEGYMAQVVSYSRALRDRQAAAGLEPLPSAAFGAEIERLMREPIAIWRPDDPRANRGDRHEP